MLYQLWELTPSTVLFSVSNEAEEVSPQLNWLVVHFVRIIVRTIVIITGSGDN